MTLPKPRAILPVRFLAYFTCDRETPLSVPVLESQQGRRSGTDQ
jgi:hypothetical protein